MTNRIRYKPILLTILGAIIGLVCGFALWVESCGGLEGPPPNPIPLRIAAIIFGGALIVFGGAVIWLFVAIVTNAFKSDIWRRGPKRSEREDAEKMKEGFRM